MLQCHQIDVLNESHLFCQYCERAERRAAYHSAIMSRAQTDEAKYLEPPMQPVPATVKVIGAILAIGFLVHRLRTLL